MVHEDSSGIIVSNTDGLFYLKDKQLMKIEAYDLANYGIELDITRGKDNKIYIATLREIVVFDDVKKKFSFIPNDSTPMQGSYSVCKDYKGNLWFASSNGLFLYDYKNFRTLYHPELVSTVTALHIYKDKTLFIGGLRGIGVLNLKSFYEKNDTTIRFYEKSSGFLGSEAAQNCFFQDSHDNIWIATNSNVVRFNPADLTESKSLPLLYIEKVTAFDNKFNYFEINDSKRKINHKNENITINFTGIYHKAPQQVFYKWTLEGFDKSVSPISKNRSVTYTNLKPGKYTFKLWACNESGVWTKEPLIYEFEIVPAFWQRLWFKIFGILLILLLIVFVSMFFAKRKQKEKLLLHIKEIEIINSKLKGQEQEKQRMSRELHDGVGGGLAALKMRTHFLESETQKNEFRKLIDGIYDEVRQISHDLSMPFSANMNENILNYLKRAFSGSGMEYSYSCVPENGWTNVSKNVQTQIYRIIQEGVTNALKHSRAKYIYVQIIINSAGNSKLIIDDDGVGMPDSAISNPGIGLQNIRGRAQVINGTLEIESSPNSGTTLVINFKI